MGTVARSGSKPRRDTQQSSSAGRPDLVVSVCHPRHLRVWRVAAPRILAAVEPESAVLVVPDHARATFVAASPSEFVVETDSRYAAPFMDSLRERVRFAGPGGSLGWYLQQLLKLAVLRTAPTGQRALIWDSDTVPLRPLRFFDDDGAPRFYAGTEVHGPYFTATRALLGYGRQIAKSFIAQCLPVQTAWSHEFFADLESGGRPWHESIIAAFDPLVRSSFSEYETLGNFFLRRHADQVRWQRGTWVRTGFRHFGAPEDAPWDQSGGEGPDFAAFESWEPPTRRRLSRLGRGSGRSSARGG